MRSRSSVELVDQILAGIDEALLDDEPLELDEPPTPPTPLEVPPVVGMDLLVVVAVEDGGRECG